MKCLEYENCVKALKEEQKLSKQNYLSNKFFKLNEPNVASASASAYFNLPAADAASSSYCCLPLNKTIKTNFGHSNYNNNNNNDNKEMNSCCGCVINDNNNNNNFNNKKNAKTIRVNKILNSSVPITKSNHYSSISILIDNNTSKNASNIISANSIINSNHNEESNELRNKNYTVPSSRHHHFNSTVGRSYSFSLRHNRPLINNIHLNNGSINNLTKLTK